MNGTASPPSWFAKGLLFENCSCQLVCPGHIHFEQDCTYDRCLGYWAIAVEEGGVDGTTLAGVNAVVAFDSPKRMMDGGWIQRIILDEATSKEQRRGMEMILRGEVGGPWAVLARFVGRHAETLYLPMSMDDDGRIKRLTVHGVMEAVVEPIRGRDKTQVVRFENIFNQIHAASQVIGRGTTRYDDGTIRMHNTGSHGLYSHFSWTA